MAAKVSARTEAKQHTAELIAVLQEQIAEIRERHPTPGYSLELLLKSCSDAIIHAQDNLSIVGTRMKRFEDSIYSLLQLHNSLSEVS